MPEPQIIYQNLDLQNKVQHKYTLLDIETLYAFLEEAGTFTYNALSNGLYPAALALNEEYSYTGYSNVWVRDNVHVATGLLAVGENEKAQQCTRSMLDFYIKHQAKIDAVLSGKSDPKEPMNRPHIRFQGETLEENEEVWPHAQNDALGYFIWLVAKLCEKGQFELNTSDAEVLCKLIDYLAKIEYWKDEDSGHWEEVRKVAASSIGPVVAGLQGILNLNENEFPEACKVFADKKSLIEDLVLKGKAALEKILPAECVQDDPEQNRRYDSALLFLIEPLNIVPREIATTIVEDVIEHLLGPHGIRRYLGDSYWCADFKTKLSSDELTGDFSDNMSDRDALLKPGEEAQWCIFDSMLSVIFGRWYLEDNNEKWKEKQIHHFNRALGQLTSNASKFGPLRGPESYYIEKGVYVPNDITPLYWTQANLQQAFAQMKNTHN